MPRKPRNPCIMHLTTRGTFYDVGYNVGTNFSDHIRHFFNESDSHQKSLLPFYNSQAGRDYYEESLRVCQECFPQYVREVQGTADGAGLPFEHVFMTNIFERCLGSVSLNKGNTEDEKNVDEFGCTTVFINSQEKKLLLHNEDCEPLIKIYGYFVSAEIQEDGQREKFTSFCYPGSLPGLAFNFNGHGLVLTSNLLYPAQIVKAAPSRAFLTRSLLKAIDVQDAVRLAKNAPFGAAYGFTVNISTKAGKMASLEVGPGKPQALVHAHDVKQQNDPDVPCHYYHFNAYKHLEVAEAKGLQSSVRRLHRTNVLPAPRNLQQALDILGDTHDTKGPIFRTPRATDMAETVCTAAFDAGSRQMLLYEGKEDLLANKPLVQLPLYQ